MKVLIVDDDSQVRLTLAKFLEQTGWDVEVAEDFESGVELLDDEVDVLLSDIKMGEKSGIDLLRRAKKRFPFIEVIMMTGYADIEDSIQALNLRAYAFLNKPFDLGEMNKSLIEAANTKLFNQREDYYKKNLERQVLEKTAQLRVEKEKLQAIFDATPSLLLTVDSDMRITDSNLIFEHYTGAPVEEVRGQLLCRYICGESEDCFSPQDQQGRKDCPIYKMIDQTLTGGEQVVRNQVNLTVQISSNRERRTILASSCLLPDRNENRHRVLLMLDDITREKEMEAQLIHSGRMSALGEMASGVAHELNQPLNGIATYIQLLQSRIDAGKATSEQELQAIYRDLLHEVGRMSDIINQLRVFHHSGTITGELDEVDIRDIYCKAVKLLRAQLGKNGIELLEHFDSGLSQINTDKSRLEQLFINLVLNARDALGEISSDRKTIEISCRPLERHQRQGIGITVSDNGPGIPPEIREKIFDPFFTTKDPDKGTGLGLAICYQFVLDMGGIIDITDNQDGGAAFHIWLPADEASVPSNFSLNQSQG